MPWYMLTPPSARPQPEADMETHQLLVADKLTVGELMTTAVLALPPLAPVRQVT